MELIVLQQCSVCGPSPMASNRKPDCDFSITEEESFVSGLHLAKNGYLHDNFKSDSVAERGLEDLQGPKTCQTLGHARVVFEIFAKPKRWISVTAPLSASSGLSAAWPSRWRVITVRSCTWPQTPLCLPGSWWLAH
jgi:hypothetical protein